MAIQVLELSLAVVDVSFRKSLNENLTFEAT
jgi:hypothetical protein